MRLKFVLKLTFIGLCATCVSGCWVHFQPGYRHGPVVNDAGVVYIGMPPPRRKREAVPDRPIIGAIWVDGYWRWAGADYVWIDGYWVRTPPEAKIWVPGKWVHSSRGWYWTEGRWR